MFYFLSTEKISLAKLEFQKLVIKDWHDGDSFFEKFGPGNVINFIDKPYERFNDYELLLEILKKENPGKYLEIHKGTPFYFLAWTAFGLKDFEKAVFYIDAAISEDQRKEPRRPLREWIKDPAGQFLTLEQQGNQSAREITLQLRDAVNKEFERFNSILNSTCLNIDSFIEKFVMKLMGNTKTRSIITAFYSFISEFRDKLVMLNLRSKEGGSIEPFLTHLFKGGLIFESLLKQLYPSAKTIGDFNKQRYFKDNFCIINTQALSISDIVIDINYRNDVETAFNTTAKLRNTTGHNLVWDDVFDNPDNYKKLYEQIINAILYIVVKKYL